MLEKKALSPELLEAQTAMELPDREMMALVVVVAPIDVTLEDVNIGVQACGVLQVGTVECDQTVGG